MAWIESHQSLGSHRKVLALCEILHIEDTKAVGLLHFLWWWALDNAPDGDLTGVSDQALARASHWHGSPTLWARTLRQVGLTDENNGERRLHDWDDYAGRLIAARESNRDRQRRHRNALRNRDNPVTSPLRHGATVPNPTQPNPTVPSAPLPPPPVPGTTTTARIQDGPHGEVYQAYENGIGPLTERLGQLVGEAITEYGASWVTLAIDQAVKANARKWAYISKVLISAKQAGHPPGTPRPNGPGPPQNGKHPSPGEWTKLKQELSDGR